MENNDNILKKIREIVGNAAENFSILEHQVDVKVQIEYFDFSRNHPSPDDPELEIQREELLYSTEVSLEEKKSLLVSLASFDKPEAYRVIERFVPKAEEGLKEWALMALQESRMLLESKLLDEQQVFISTGLGGGNGKLRYFVVVFSYSGEPFTQTQKELLRSEFEFTLPKFKAEVEEIRFELNYATLMALVPLDVPVKEPFDATISECNSLGEFVHEGFIITNVKKLTSNEIEEIKKNPPSETFDVE
ncbi:MAG TPA: hypothetical protein PL017_07865 [Tenuifilaceae bacterium]|nr:hypothetical protein [Tenuifilaceae bacterium]HPE18800.1 hypothetical protein [Tenuifilaceae bacterium]HPJ45999.1 hypothetical protein [Tenuifilaceae bacterium]HPQ34379.1 hypothetical protein [Tenuifilaceae bacterium]HRX68539.1 hypothetical protein [Tenuifilaceae bacterium]